jgi:gamma-glutamyltranspeptidase
VVYPNAGNIGGGGFMTIRFKDGKSTFLDFRERAPLAATKTMYLDKDGKPGEGRQPRWLSRGRRARLRGMVSRWRAKNTAPLSRRI